MTIKEIYEKVCIVVPIEQRLFFHRLNDTVAEILALYPEVKIIKDGEKWCPVWSLDGFISVRGLYIPAIVDNILFLSGAGEGYKSEFIRKAENAYKRYNSGDSRTRIIKRAGW